MRSRKSCKFSRTVKGWDSLESRCLPKLISNLKFHSTQVYWIQFLLLYKALYLGNCMGPEGNKKAVAFFICFFFFSFVITFFIADINGCIWTLYEDRVCMASFWNFVFFWKWNVGYGHWEYIMYIQSTI